MISVPSYRSSTVATFLPKRRSALFDDPSHHLAALSPHDDTESNSNSPILPPAIAPLPACPKPSWAQVLDAEGPSTPPRRCASSPFTPFFLLSHPTPAPERLSAAVVHPELMKMTELYLKGPGDLALLAYSVVLFSFLRVVLSHTLFPMLARRWGIREAGKVARFREQGYAAVYFAVVGIWGVYTLSTTPASSALKPRTPHFCFDRRRAHARSCVVWRLATSLLSMTPIVSHHYIGAVANSTYKVQNLPWENILKTTTPSFTTMKLSFFIPLPFVATTLALACPDLSCLGGDATGTA
ncbi:hypothetical protein B0H13DRAFT_2405518 [Mycena leptocephala]|nr:hypothetical protein B0H13DRAFT_2405518 [Mycena leptocephala]